MYIDSNSFDSWMKRIMERFDRLEKHMEKPDKPVYSINGERLYDNQDLCFMLNCSKRTLQRFRVSGLLSCRRINQKTYYLESEVLRFIRENLKKQGEGEENPE